MNGIGFAAFLVGSGAMLKLNPFKAEKRVPILCGKSDFSAGRRQRQFV